VDDVEKFSTSYILNVLLIMSPWFCKECKRFDFFLRKNTFGS
jgi:hypothetical protein